MRLNEKLVRLRKEKGLTQSKLAETVEVSRQTVSKWEAGIAIPSSENLRELSGLYGVSVDNLLTDHVECLDLSETAEIPNSDTDQQLKIPALSMPQPAVRHRNIKMLGIVSLILILAFVSVTIYIKTVHENREPLEFGELGSDDLSDAELDGFSMDW